MKVSKLVKRFLEHQKQQGNEPNTLENYAGRLKRFNDKYGSQKVTKVSRRKLIKFLHDSAAGLADGTKRQNITVVQRLQKYALKFGHISELWIQPDDIKKPPQGRRKDFPSLDEVALIIAELRPDAVPIFRCLRLTGARPGELCNARVEDVRGEPGKRVIILKKHKTVKKMGEQRLILSPDAEAIVTDEVAGRESGPIFRTARGKAWLRDRLSRDYRRARNKLNLPKSYVLYSTRHEAATLIVRAKGLAHAQKVLRHSTVKTTEVYAHLDEDDVRDSVTVIADVKPNRTEAA